MKRLDLLFVPFGLLISLGLSGTAGAQTESRDRRPAIPVHEAYLPPKLEEVAARTSIPPPRSIASMVEPKSGDSAIWIDGYWDFDAATQRFVWVEGVWRVAPPGRFWVVGYWARSASGGYERVAGYWADERRGSIEFSGPPAARPAENPGVSPGADRFYIAGHYEPKERGVGVVWKPGYWSKMQSGWSWIPAAWLKRPAGWAFQEGYWIQTDRLSDPPRGGRAISMTPSETERLARLQGIASARARALTIDPNGPRSVLNDVTSSMNSVLNVAPGGLLRPNNNLAPNNRSRLPGGGYEMLTPAPGTGRDGVGTQIPAPTYYIGHSAPGASYPSYSTSPGEVLGQRTYIGHSAPGSSYPSYSTSPTAVPGQSYYIGNSAPGSTYPSYSTSGTSVGGYGLGASPPGTNTGGQVGTTNP